MSEENNNDQGQSTLETGPIEITPEKFLAILQEGRELEAITTGNFTLRELINVKFFFLDFIEGIIMDKLSQKDEQIFNRVKDKLEERKDNLESDLQGEELNIFQNYFKETYEFEKIFDSRDYPEEMQGEVEDFISDLLGGETEAEIDELNQEAEERKEKQAGKDNKDNEDKIVNLADYKKE